MKKFDLRNVPNQPGVYLWKNKANEIVYVGKAQRLKTRIQQYIKGSLNSYKTQKMMAIVTDFEYIISSSAKEALLLERNLITKYKPYYNIKLLDDKRYPYIKIALLKKELKINLSYRVHQKSSNILYFGPFPSGYGAKKMADFLNRCFVFEKGLPIRNQTATYWKKQFEEVKKLIFKQKSLTKVLNQKMQNAASNMQYEIAQDIKETLNAIKSSHEKQVAEIKDNKTIDVIAFYQKSGYVSISQLFYRQGMLLATKENIVEITTSLSEVIRQFVAQYYAVNLEPTLLITNHEIETDIPTIIPQKGIKKQILNVALTNGKDNIDFKLEKFIRREKRTIGALKKLQELLKLPKLSHILMVDNSNFANKNPVSAVVSYRNGIKNKAEYRKYKLTLTERQADVEYMRQAITRHFKNETNPYPDLLIVDGGKQQVNEIKKFFTKAPIIGLVKNDKHQTRALITSAGEEIELTEPNLYLFLAEIQIEVDRFAKKTYQHRARKSSFEGALKNIPGVGPKVEEKLLNHFHSYAAIYNASEIELSNVVSSRIASAIKKGLQNYEDLISSR